MRSIFCGLSGTDEQPQPLPWHEMALERDWEEVGQLLSGGRSPRPLQTLAIGKEAILSHTKNLIVSAPTNSGKSLVGWMVLLQAVASGKRALLLEPLRALAREKADEMEAIAGSVGELLGIPLSVRIATGDYRLEDEQLFDGPPQGELIVATPERIEALLRNPVNQAWLNTIGAVCVDEAHLISSDRRGMTLEYLITALLCLSPPPRLVLLSATMGDVTEAKKWLNPCEVLQVQQRYPPLEKWVLALDEEEDANGRVVAWIEAALAEPEVQILVFVYQTKAAQSLAKLLNEQLGMGVNALAYHGQMSQQQRGIVRQEFVGGNSKVIVTTTALALGINLPATHVLVRDNTFPGVGRLSVGELLQMMGRAGRGDRSGKAAVLGRSRDGWKVDELVLALQAEVLPTLESAFNRSSGRTDLPRNMPRIAPQLAALLSRWQEQGMTVEDLERFLDRSLGGAAMVGQVGETLRWLENQVLAFLDPISQRYFLTVLGKKATRTVLPLPIAASYGQLLRDLMSLDSEDGLLQGWQPLDHLLILDLLSERPPSLRRFSARLVKEVDGWSEGDRPERSLLFTKWMRGTEATARTIEVMGSLGIEPKGAKDEQAWAHQTGYLAMLRVIVLWERSQGRKIPDLEQQYGLTGLAGIEERWRDESLWLLSGIGKLLDLRVFYYHLKEDCQANKNRIQRVKKLLRKMQFQVYGLQEQLKYCSPLGGFLAELRRTSHDKSKVGVQSMRRLEDAGIETIADLRRLSVEDMMRLGVKRKMAMQIRQYFQRRMI